MTKKTGIIIGILVVLFLGLLVWGVSSKQSIAGATKEEQLENMEKTNKYDVEVKDFVDAHQVSTFDMIKEGRDFYNQFNIINTSKKQQIINENKDTNKPQIFYYFAYYCGHCKMIKPGMQELVDQGVIKKESKFYAIDLEYYKDAAKDNEEITGTPMIEVYKNGKIIDTFGLERDGKLSDFAKEKIKTYLK